MKLKSLRFYLDEYLLRYMLVALFFLQVTISYAQERKVTGKVIAAGDNFGLPGVNVIIKGTNDGTVTDFDGNYAITVPEGATLIFSFIGYASQEIVVGSQSVIDVSLETDVQALEEVVVIGYGTTTEKELTGSVKSIKSEQITKVNPIRIESAIQGQISGVQITSSSGAPGGNQNIRIRGVNSNGDNRPLIIVDGIRFGDDLNTIDPNIIADITVLKDASAAIYGVLGANGVIIVTTKTGRKDYKPELSVSGYYGFQQRERTVDVLNATEFAILTNEALVAGGQAPAFTNIGELGEGTNFQDEVFEIAPVQNYSINYRGSTEKTNYSVGASYFSQEGIVGGPQSGFDRVNVNVNLTQELYQNLKLTTNLGYINVQRQTIQENVAGSVLFNAINISPTNPVRDETGNFTTTEGQGFEIVNPVRQIESNFNDVENNRLSGLLALNYEIIDGLSVQTSFNFNYADVIFNQFNPIISFGIPDQFDDKVFDNPRSSVTEDRQNFISYNVDNVLTYETNFGEHELTFTLGNSVFKNLGSSLTVTGFDIPNNSLASADISQALADEDNAFRSIPVFDTRQLSYFGRVEYGYQNKYLLSGLLRVDNTSIFAPENQTGVFGSVSGGWLFSEESFFPKSSLFNFGKLRASYGAIGNDRVPPFPFIAILSGEAEAVFDGEEIVFGQSIGQLANPEVQWETTLQFDVGFDLGFLDDRVSVTADYYLKNTRDLLLIGAQESGLTGVAAPGSASPIINAGSVRNRGFEFSINYSEEVAPGLKLTANVNYANNRNETISLNGESPITIGSFNLSNDPPISTFTPGLPLGAYLGLQTDGIFQTAEEVAASAQAGTAQPGDLRFVDVNGDGQITQDGDATFIGSPIPENIFGFSLSLDYQGFDFSTLWEGQTGHSFVRNFERNLPFSNRRREAINRFTGSGTSNTFPRLTTGATDNNLFSDFFIEDGDYLRIRNVQLGYTLPQSVLDKLRSTKVRIYLSVNNVFTFTDISGFDPSASTGNTSLDSTNDRGFFPQARTYIIGFNLGF